jgi:hypothetical protein
MDSMTGDRARFSGRIAGWILPAACWLQLIPFSYFLVRSMIREPFMDMLDWLTSYLSFQDDGGFGAYLWAFHNEHHLVWMRLLTMIDVEVFLSAGFAFIVVGTASLLASALLVAHFIKQESRASLPAAAWLAPMLILTPINAIDCGIPIFTVYPIAVFFMIGSLVLFEGPTNWHRALALPAAVCAAFGNGAALVVWPVLIWICWRQRTGVIWIAAVAAAGLLFIAAYTHGTPSATPLSDAFQSGLLGPGNVLKMLKYALAFAGLPFSRAPELGIAGRIMSYIVPLAAAVAVVHVSLFESANTRLSRIGGALILVTLSAAVIAAIGRTHLEAGIKVPVRYAVLVAPMHAGLLCCALDALGRRTRKGPGWIAIAGFVAVLIATNFLVGARDLRVIDRMRTAIEAYYLGERGQEVVDMMYPDAAEAERMTSQIRERGLLADD